MKNKEIKKALIKNLEDALSYPPSFQQIAKVSKIYSQLESIKK